jgi:hypothetical protein
MTQPVRSSVTAWEANRLGPPPPPELPTQPSTRSVQDLPDHSQGQRDILLQPRPATGTRPSDWERSAVGAGLDAFLARAAPTFVTAEGWVAVSIGFYMNDPRPNEPLEAVARAAGLSADQARWVTQGRGSPEAIAKVTQALIDSGHLPARSASGSTAPCDRIRQMMYDWRLGLDCAGYVAAAILASRGVTRAQAGLLRPDHEDLSHLSAQGYASLPRESANRPGDVYVMHENPPTREVPNPVGHRAIVREAGPASPAEIDRVKAMWPSLPAAARASTVWQRIVVDSSFGNGQNPLNGGVRRDTWWHDRTTGVWAWDWHGEKVVTEGPYNHKTYEVMRLRSAQ